MTSGSQTTTLGALVESSTGFIQTGPFGSQLHARDYVEDGIPVVMPQQLGDNEIRSSDIAFVGEHDRDRLLRHVMCEGDIVFSRRGDVTRRAYITRRESGWLCGTGCLLLRLNHPACDNRYLVRFLGLQGTREYLTQNAIGATMPNLNQGILSSVPVVLPPRDRQERIVDVISAYDDLIENNRKRIRLLEQAARMLYEEWFVRLRFPGHEHVRITNSMPDGWKTTRLGKVISELESGKRPRGGSSVQGVPSIGAENILGLGQYEYGKEKFIPADYFASMNKGIVKNRDVVIYKDGANVGRSSYFGDGFPHEKCAVNEHVFRCRALPEIGQNFLYFWVSQDDTRQRIANLNSNTAQPGVSRAKIETLSFTQPAPDVLRRFNDIVEPFIGQTFLLARTCQKLSKVRDHLLSHVIPTKIA